MDTSLLLVHSPLMGPSSWGAAARAFERRGYEVATPDLTGAVTASTPSVGVVVDTAVAAAAHLTGPIVVIGHSGAGAFVPAIAGALGERVAALVFVDAVLPPTAGAHETPARLRTLLDQQTVGGLLRRWMDWWPADTVERLIPDPGDRALLVSDMPRVPRALYDEAVPVPDGWSDVPCAYLKLSDAYAAELEESDARGWLGGELATDHLAVHTRAEPVAHAITTLVEILVGS